MIQLVADDRTGMTNIVTLTRAGVVASDCIEWNVIVWASVDNQAKLCFT